MCRAGKSLHSLRFGTWPIRASLFIFVKNNLLNGGIMNRKAFMIGIMLIVACGTMSARAKLSEKGLAQHKAAILSRVIDDNPEQDADIRTLFNGTVMEGNMGIRLLDKFGIFMSNMEKKGIEIRSTRFYRKDDVFTLFFVMKDGKDDQLYNLFLEYGYGRKGRCVLKDIYFSIVFEERMNEIRSFFEAR